MLKQIMTSALLFCLFLHSKTAQAQVEIQVFGSHYPDELKQYANDCFLLLNIGDQMRVNIFITDHLPYPYEGRTIKHPPDSAGTQQFSVHVQSGLRSDKQLLILAHELIHIRQYASGQLDVDGEQVYWHGKKYYLSEDNISSTPWENDAYANDDHLTKKFLTIRRHAQKQISEAMAKNENGKVGRITVR